VLDVLLRGAPGEGGGDDGGEVPAQRDDEGECVGRVDEDLAASAEVDARVLDGASRRGDE
jgi:hypothetical protein